MEEWKISSRSAFSNPYSCTVKSRFNRLRTRSIGCTWLACIGLLPIISIHVNLRWPACSAITQLCVGCSSSPWPVSLSSPSWWGRTHTGLLLLLYHSRIRLRGSGVSTGSVAQPWTCLHHLPPEVLLLCLSLCSPFSHSSSSPYLPSPFLSCCLLVSSALLWSCAHAADPSSLPALSAPAPHPWSSVREALGRPVS